MRSVSVEETDYKGMLPLSNQSCLIIKLSLTFTTSSKASFLDRIHQSHPFSSQSFISIFLVKMDSLPADFFVTSMQFTKRVSREVYPSVDPSSPELSMAGKVVIITGASQGIGAKVRLMGHAVVCKSSRRY